MWCLSSRWKLFTERVTQLFSSCVGVCLFALSLCTVFTQSYPPQEQYSGYLYAAYTFNLYIDLRMWDCWESCKRNGVIHSLEARSTYPDHQQSTTMNYVRVRISCLAWQQWPQRRPGTDGRDDGEEYDVGGVLKINWLQKRWLHLIHTITRLVFSSSELQRNAVLQWMQLNHMDVLIRHFLKQAANMLHDVMMLIDDGRTIHDQKSWKKLYWVTELCCWCCCFSNLSQVIKSGCRCCCCWCCVVLQNFLVQCNRYFPVFKTTLPRSK